MHRIQYGALIPTLQPIEIISLKRVALPAAHQHRSLFLPVQSPLCISFPRISLLLLLRTESRQCLTITFLCLVLPIPLIRSARRNLFFTSYPLLAWVGFLREWALHFPSSHFPLLLQHGTRKRTECSIKYSHYFHYSHKSQRLALQ